MRKRLIALRHILFEAHQYKPGEELPAHNHGMVEAWLKNGAAKWNGGEEAPPEGPETPPEESETPPEESETPPEEAVSHPDTKGKAVKRKSEKTGE